MARPELHRPQRGFDWRLAPLQLKRAWDVDAARMAVARELAQWQTASTALHAAEAALREASQEARRALLAKPDPRTHQRLLGHLIGLGEEVARSTARQAEAAGQLSAAQQALLQKQQGLDVLQRACRDALAQHRQEQLRREQSDADASWLATSALRSKEGAL